MGILGKNIKKEFPVFAAHPEMVYLDNASTTQKPQSVIDAMNDYQIHSYANIHRGVYALAEMSELLYHESKKKVAQLIGGDYREIVYTYNATYASNILAQSLIQTYKIGLGDTVLVGIRDHHATIVPRQLLSQQWGFVVEFIAIHPESGDIDRDQLESTLYHKNVKVLVCSHVSNVTGIIYDMSRLSALLGLKSERPFFAIDGSQAVSHMQIDVKTIGCDAYFFTGHKMMGPTGIGVLWIDKLQARQLHTSLGGGGIVEFVTVDGCALIRTADKFEPGTPNLIGAIGLGAACDFYVENDIYAYISTYADVFYHDIVQGLSHSVNFSVLGGGYTMPNTGMISLVVEDPFDCAEYLSQSDICVRAGGHCAHPLLHHFGQDKGVLRISPFVYTSREDIITLLDRLNHYTP